MAALVKHCLVTSMMAGICWSDSIGLLIEHNDTQWVTQPKRQFGPSLGIFDHLN